MSATVPGSGFDLTAQTQTDVCVVGHDSIYNPQYEQLATENLASALQSGMQSENKRFDTVKWETPEPDLQVLCAEAVKNKDEEDPYGRLPLDEIGKGSAHFVQEARAIEDGLPPKHHLTGSNEERVQIAKMEECRAIARDLSALEKPVLLHAAMLQVTREVCTTLGVEAPQAVDFVKMVGVAKERIKTDDRKTVLERHADNYRETLNSQSSPRFPLHGTPLEAIGQYPNYRVPGSIVEGVPGYIASMFDRNATALSLGKGDIPKILAYLTANLAQDNKNLDMETLGSGVMLALDHALRNEDPESPGVRKLRDRINPQGVGLPRMSHILRRHAPLFFSAGFSHISNAITNVAAGSHF